MPFFAPILLQLLIKSNIFLYPIAAKSYHKPTIISKKGIIGKQQYCFLSRGY